MVHREQIIPAENGLLVLAPAKINLSLLIAGKRPDGFHEIETVMAKINWYDEILIESGRGQGIELICEGPEWAPAGQDNLIYKAARTLLESCDLPADIRITLTKNIPAGTGLGSASSDAAATLIGLNRYLQLGVENGILLKIAAELGSDVAFFLGGPLSLCTGKGEKVQKIDENFHFLSILVLPCISVSTQKVYSNYRHDSGTYEKLSLRIKEYVKEKRIDLVAKMCANMLEDSCFDLVKKLAGLKRRIESLGIGPCCLSGSGSAMFCVIEGEDKEIARIYKRQIDEMSGFRSVIVSNNRW